MEYQDNNRCNIFSINSKSMIGMIHVPALPGTPFNRFSPKEIINKCLEEATIYKSANIDSIMIENMHDAPYLKRSVGPEITSMMSIIGYELRKVFPDKPIGIQILAGANKDAISAALSADLDYIRGEGFIFGHVADEGIFESDAGELLRYRKNIGADRIKVYTDIKKKHGANQITKDVSIADMSKNANFFGSDGIIITGTTTGGEAELNDLKQAKEGKLPVLLGSGITNDNLENYFDYSNGFIVGSYFKKDGLWSNELDFKKVESLVNQFNNLKKNKGYI
jgi:hypothetical protein